MGTPSKRAPVKTSKIAEATRERIHSYLDRLLYKRIKVTDVPTRTKI